MSNIFKFHLALMSIAIIIIIIAEVLVEQSMVNMHYDLKDNLLSTITNEMASKLLSEEKNLRNYLKDYSEESTEVFMRIFPNGIVIGRKKIYGNNVKIAREINNLLKNGKIQEGYETTFYYYNKNTLYRVLGYERYGVVYILLNNINKMLTSINSKNTTIEVYITSKPEHNDAIKITEIKNRNLYIDYKNTAYIRTLAILRLTSLAFTVFFIVSITMSFRSQKNRWKLQKILTSIDALEIPEVKTKIRGFPNEILQTFKNLVLELKEKNYKLESINDLTRRKNKIIENLFVSNPEEYFELSYYDFFKVTLNSILEILFHGEKGSVVMADKDTYKFIAMNGYDINLYKNIRLFPNQLFIDFSKTESKLTIIKDPLKSLKEEGPMQSKLNTYGNLHNLKETLAAPIRIEGKINTVIYIDIFSENNHFSNSDIELMQYFVAYVGAFLRNKIYYDKIIELSNTDELTGIYNRRYFEKILSNEIKKTQRYDYKDSLLYFDLDDFKLINDTYGHKIGDEVLKVFVNEIKKHLRNSDTFARFGGDEFIALLPFTEKDEITKKIDELEKLNIHLIYNDKKIKIKYSIGYSIIPDDGKDENEIIIKADMKMYEDKIKRKNAKKN